MLEKFTENEMVALCRELVMSLSGGELVNNEELMVPQGVGTSCRDFGNEIEVSWDVPRTDSRLVSALHYIDEDSIRVDVNISVNRWHQVIEVDLWKYADKKISTFPEKSGLEIQDLG